MNNLPFTTDELYEFIDKAGKATYAGGASDLPNPERPDFHELEYKEGDFYYRDSYTGQTRARGMEVVRFEGKPVWTCAYGGGMAKGKDELDSHCYEFLKKSLSAEEAGFKSFRGPHNFTYGDWKYEYTQDGDIEEFNGYEEIYYKDELVFFHRAIGGTII